MYINCAAHAYCYEGEMQEMEMCHFNAPAQLAKSRQVGCACGDGRVCFPLSVGRWEVMYLNRADMMFMRAICLAALLCPLPSSMWEEPH